MTQGWGGGGEAGAVFTERPASVTLSAPRRLHATLGNLSGAGGEENGVHCLRGSAAVAHAGRCSRWGAAAPDEARLCGRSTSAAKCNTAGMRPPTPQLPRSSLPFLLRRLHSENTASPASAPTSRNQDDQRFTSAVKSEFRFVSLVAGQSSDVSDCCFLGLRLGEIHLFWGGGSRA